MLAYSFFFVILLSLIVHSNNVDKGTFLFCILNFVFLSNCKLFKQIKFVYDDVNSIYSVLY